MVIRLQRHPLAEDPPSHKKASKVTARVKGFTKQLATFVALR